MGQKPVKMPKNQRLDRPGLLWVGKKRQLRDVRMLTGSGISNGGFL
jgi:hypothetical protein